MVRMLSDMPGIEQRCDGTMGLFEWSSIRLGNPLRNHAYALPDWFISLTSENIDEIRARSKSHYTEQGDWVQNDESMNRLSVEASVKSGLSDTNRLMNVKVAEYAGEHAAGLERSTKRIVDVGTGSGWTIIPALQEMHKRGVDLASIEALLIEPSKQRLEFAVEKIRETLERQGAPSPTFETRVDTADTLKTEPSDSFDLVIQTAAIHHDSFKDHLADICRVLRPGMPFISGDWHDGNYETPARIFWIYKMLQNPDDEKTEREVLDFVLKGKCPSTSARKELMDFRDMYALTDEVLASAYRTYTDSERKASVGGMRYWVEMAKMFEKKGAKCPELLIQCHERVAMRLIAFENAGLTRDDECRRKYVEVISKMGFGELGAVMMAKKPRPARIAR